MQKLMQLAIVVLLGIIATALLNSRSKSEIGIPPAPLPQSAASGALPGTQVQPFQTQVACSMLGGINQASQNFTAPSRELVIQTISMYRTNVTSGTWGQVYVHTTVNGGDANYALPYIGDTTILPFPGVTLAAVIYADPGTPVFLNCYRTGTSGTETDYISVSGYVMSDRAPLAKSDTAEPPAGPLTPTPAGLPPSPGLPMFTRVPAQ